MNQSQVGVPAIAQASTSLKAVRVPIPSMKEQISIVKILDSLTNKIELNNQIITTLEELAATLFKRWFVDFEFPDENVNPYKTSCGKMTESELGEIPEGWEVGKLSDIGEIIGGGTPSKKKEEYFKEGTISWITPKDLSEQKNVFISRGKTNITNLGLSKSSARLIPAKSVLFSSRAPIGYIAIASKEVSTNQGFKSVVPKEINQSEFVYLLLKNKVTDIESRATGSTFKEVSGSIMKKFPVIIPDSKIINIFCSIVKCWFWQIENLEQENDSLNDTRNILLPRLLSGEYEVV
ncbi:type I restriction enzyme, S subunit [Enterococcus sp. AZ135]